MWPERPKSAAGYTMKTGLEPHAMLWKGSCTSRIVAYIRDREAEISRPGRVTPHRSSITTGSGVCKALKVTDVKPPTPPDGENTVM